MKKRREQILRALFVFAFKRRYNHEYVKDYFWDR